jgi:hypothetical protein
MVNYVSDMITGYYVYCLPSHNNHLLMLLVNVERVVIGVPSGISSIYQYIIQHITLLNKHLVFFTLEAETQSSKLAPQIPSIHYKILLV